MKYTLSIQFFGGRGKRSGVSGGGNGGGGVTPTSIPSLSVDNIQKFVDQFGIGMSVRELVEKVYRALPNKGTANSHSGLVGNKGVSILNSRYTQIDDGPILQSIKQKSKGSWKVKQV